MLALKRGIETRGAVLRTLVVLAALLASGCGAGISQLSKQIPREATPAAVKGGLDAFDDPATRERLRRIVASPEMRAVEREVLAGVVDGAIDTFTDEERARRIGEATSRAMSGAMQGLSRGIPGVTHDITRGAVGGALDAASDPARRAALQGTVGWLVSTTIQSATRGIEEAQLGEAAAGVMTDQLGPALETTLRDDLAPGLAGVLKNEELRLALGETARTLGREMVLGVTEGLSAQKPPPESDSLLSRATKLADKGVSLFGSAAWLLLLVIVALCAWVVKLIAQARRYRGEASRREATAHLLEEAAKASEGKPWSGELLGTLQARIRAEEKALEELRHTRRGRHEPPRPHHA